MRESLTAASRESDHEDQKGENGQVPRDESHKVVGMCMAVDVNTQAVSRR
jgi:hypothetical protein